MCNFNRQNEETKAFLHIFMIKIAEALGGVNFLLGLTEALRAVKPNPLIAKRCEIKSPNLVISWNKIVFQDKLMALEEALLIHKSSENQDFNIIGIDNQKKKKRTINMVKALAPIKFTIAPINKELKGGFEFSIFEIVDFNNDYVKINPIFTALFFCSTEYMKKALKFEV